MVPQNLWDLLKTGCLLILLPVSCKVMVHETRQKDRKTGCCVTTRKFCN